MCRGYFCVCKRLGHRQSERKRKVLDEHGGIWQNRRGNGRVDNFRKRIKKTRRFPTLVKRREIWYILAQGRRAPARAASRRLSGIRLAVQWICRADGYPFRNSRRLFRFTIILRRNHYDQLPKLPQAVGRQCPFLRQLRRPSASDRSVPQLRQGIPCGICLLPILRLAFEGRRIGKCGAGCRSCGNRL